MGQLWEKLVVKLKKKAKIERTTSVIFLRSVSAAVENRPSNLSYMQIKHSFPHFVFFTVSLFLYFTII